MRAGTDDEGRNLSGVQELQVLILQVVSDRVFMISKREDSELDFWLWHFFVWFLTVILSLLEPVDL